VYIFVNLLSGAFTEYKSRLMLLDKLGIWGLPL